VQERLPGLADGDLKNFYEVARTEPIFRTAFIADSNVNYMAWRVRLSRELIYFEDVDTSGFGDYLTRITNLVTPEPVAIASNPPSAFGLAEQLDYFNIVWELRFGKKLLQSIRNEQVTLFAFDATTSAELSARLTALSELIKNLLVPGVSGLNVGSLRRLVPFVKENRVIDAASEQRMNEAVAVLSAVQDVRHKLYQHVGTESRGVTSLGSLSIRYPISDFYTAWNVIRAQVIDAVAVLREEVDASGDRAPTERSIAAPTRR
jgi:hypothetical protein